MSKPPPPSRLARATASAATPSPLDFDSAVVTSADPLEVTWRGATGIPCTRNADYTPTVGDVVLFALIDHQPVVFFQLV